MYCLYHIINQLKVNRKTNIGYFLFCIKQSQKSNSGGELDPHGSGVLCFNIIVCPQNANTHDLVVGGVVGKDSRYLDFGTIENSPG